MSGSWWAGSSQLLGLAENPELPSFGLRKHRGRMRESFEHFAERAGLEPGWISSIPTSGFNQSCAFCTDPKVRWVHALDPALVQYRVYGKGHTLPTFWTVCDRCETLYQAGDEEALLAAMTASPEWSRWTKPADLAEHVRQPLAVFTRADLGARALTR